MAFGHAQSSPDFGVRFQQFGIREPGLQRVEERRAAAFLEMCGHAVHGAPQYGPGPATIEPRVRHVRRGGYAKGLHFIHRHDGLTAAAFLPRGIAAGIREMISHGLPHVTAQFSAFWSDFVEIALRDEFG